MKLMSMPDVLSTTLLMWFASSPKGTRNIHQGRSAPVVRASRARFDPSAPTARPRPLPAVGWPLNAFHMHPVLGRIARRTPGDDDAIARFQRVFVDAPLLQARRAGPLGGNLAHGAGLVFGVHMNPRVWTAVVDLHDLAFDRDPLVLEVVGRERVVGRGRNARRNAHQNECQQRTFHVALLDDCIPA